MSKNGTNKRRIRLKDIVIPPSTPKERAVTKDIRIQGKSQTHCLPSAPFQRVVSETLMQDGEYQISAKARDALQVATEQFLINDVFALASKLKDRITKTPMRDDDLKPKNPRPTLFPRDMRAALACDPRNDRQFKAWLTQKDKEEYEREKSFVEKVSRDFVGQKRSGPQSPNRVIKKTNKFRRKTLVKPEKSTNDDIACVLGRL